MSTPTSGAISINDLRNEFEITGSNLGSAMNNYYRTGSLQYLANVVGNHNIPTSGTISLYNFYNTRNEYYYWPNFSVYNDPGQKNYTQVWRWNGSIVGYNTNTTFTTGGYTYYKGSLFAYNSMYSIRR